MDFKTGDTVRLKSGGPTMTVRNPKFADEVQCSWFAGEKREVATFYADELEPFKEAAMPSGGGFKAPV